MGIGSGKLAIIHTIATTDIIPYRQFFYRAQPDLDANKSSSIVVYSIACLQLNQII